MFESYFKKRKIRKYARKLPYDLKLMYGYKEYYAKAEVDAAIKRKKIDNNAGVVIGDSCYAYAMYCSPEEFKAIHDEAGENCDYGAMRSEISHTLFNGQYDFTFTTLLADSTSSSTNSTSDSGNSSFGSGFGGSDSGGFGGGDGGGGGGD